MRKEIEVISIEELCESELLELLLSEPPSSQDLISICEYTAEKNKIKSEKREKKKLKKRLEKDKLKTLREDKKIKFLLEGDRLAEVKRCKRWEAWRALTARWALQTRGLRSMSGGSETPSKPIEYKPIPLKYCSICKRNHP